MHSFLSKCTLIYVVPFTDIIDSRFAKCILDLNPKLTHFQDERAKRKSTLQLKLLSLKLRII